MKHVPDSEGLLLVTPCGTELTYTEKENISDQEVGKEFQEQIVCAAGMAQWLGALSLTEDRGSVSSTHRVVHNHL